MKLAILLLALILLAGSQTGFPPPGSFPPPNSGDIPPGSGDIPPTQTNTNFNGGGINPMLMIYSTLSKVQMIRRILKMMKDSGIEIPCFIKHLIKTLSRTQLKKLMDWLEENLETLG